MILQGSVEIWEACRFVIVGAMDTEKGLNGFDGVGGKTEKTMSEVEAEALKKCLEEKKGEQEIHSKCKSKIEAFQSSSSSSHSKKPLGPLKLRSGSLTDV